MNLELKDLSLTEGIKRFEYRPLVEMPSDYCREMPVKFEKLPKDNKVVFNIIVASNIKTFREAKGITRTELDKKVKVPLGTTKAIEEFEKEVSAYELFKYAKELGVSIDDLASIRLDHRVKKLSPFEAYACPVLMRSFEKFVRKELFSRKDISTTVLKRAINRFDEYPELWKFVAKLNKEKLKKAVKIL